MKYSLALAIAAATAASADSLSRFQSRPLNKDTSKRAGGDSNWGGAVQEGQGWTHVTGTVTVPDVSGQDAQAGAAGWVGIDGSRCRTGLLQTGFAVFGDGHIEAWYEWYPEPSYTYDGLTVSAGDELRLSVYAHGLHGGNSTIENLTTGRSAAHTFTDIPESLCLTDAEWIVEDFSSGNQPVAFADFGEMQFTDAYAEGANGKVSPQGSQIMEVTIDGEPHTSCSASAGGVDCKYI
ncbi:peptidase A4 family protein [Cordyceps javanica]|uniref:Peptidase A4 family protein n=1 Tax=Cordyceps javanica TaxID=43265 RepID=A0A545V1M1_9HYPO|nr:peptidase A4 family protein [Cordyceps javanica]TQW07217.1 peptidase A4 family protein [Cordyceps javanica]